MPKAQPFGLDIRLERFFAPEEIEGIVFAVTILSKGNIQEPVSTHDSQSALKLAGCAHETPARPKHLDILPDGHKVRVPDFSLHLHLPC